MIDPISILNKAKKFLSKKGFIYVEVPDAEEASKRGKKRDKKEVNSGFLQLRLSGKKGVKYVKKKR